MTMALSSAFFSVCLIFASSWQSSIAIGPTPPLPVNVSVVADGFSWIENICFDGNGTMFASELNRGQLLMIVNTGTESNPAYVTSMLINNNDGLFKKFLGCVVDEERHPGMVFVSGEYQNDTSALFAVPVNNPDNWEIVAYTTAGVGNGIGLHEKTGIIYTTAEGTFLPGGGVVYQFDLTQEWGGKANIITSQWACDGLWIDQELDILYVGLLFSANVWTYSLASQQELGVYGGMKHKWCKELVCAMDDFTLSQSNSSLIIGCAWTNNTLTTFPTFSPESGYEQKALLSHIQNPSSVRWGSGLGGFASTSLYISEGCGLQADVTKCRILEWKHADLVV